MALYYFEIEDAFPPIPCIGAELASLADARAYALRYAGELLATQPASFWTAHEWTMVVSDQHHLTLFTISVLSTDAPVLMAA